MDFDLRQWLLILGPVFVAGVLVHGYFRMRAGQNEIRMKLDKSFVSKPGEEGEAVDDLNLLRAELPNGGARVIGMPDLDEDVPLLMESVELPSISAVDESVVSAQPKKKPAKPEQQSLDITAPKAPPAITDDQPAASIETPEALTASAEDEPSAEKDTGSGASRKRAPAEARAEDEDAKAQSAVEKPEKFVVMHVLALDDPFGGQALLELLLEAGMSFGEMDIFHRLDNANEPLFSLASAVEPGTFDLAAMDRFSTPGVTLFMRVHELEKPVDVLEEMLAVADAIARDLGGEVRDETRSVMTPQTIEHCRQSIREFQFKHSA